MTVTPPRQAIFRDVEVVVRLLNSSQSQDTTRAQLNMNKIVNTRDTMSNTSRRRIIVGSVYYVECATVGIYILSLFIISCF